MVSNPSALERASLVGRVAPRAHAGAVLWIVAPEGYGKTALLEAVVAARRRRGGDPALRLSLAVTEAHPGLFVEALVDALRRLDPAARVGAWARSAGEARGWLRAGLADVMAAASLPALDLLVDEVDQLAPGDPLTTELGLLAASPPPGLGLVLAGRHRPPFGEGAGSDVPMLGARELAFDEDEVRALLAARLGAVEPSLAAAVWRQTGGWPAMVDLVASAGADLAGDNAGVEGLVERLLARLRPEARLVASVAAVLGRFEPEMLVAVLAADVPGPTRARRRMVRLSEAVTREALEALQAGQLVYPAAEGAGEMTLNPLLRRSLRRRLRQTDEDAYREAHRRAAEVLLRAGPGEGVAPLDMLLEAGELDRLGDLLERRAEGLYRAGHAGRLGRWLRALRDARAGDVPGWVAYYLGRIAADEGRWDEARQELDRARLAFTEGAVARGAWRWQPRISLAYALMLWRRGALPEVHTWCRRGLDAAGVAERRGQVPEGGLAELAALKAELQALAARATMEISGYDKARAELEAALKVADAAGLGTLRARVLLWLARNALRAAELDAGDRWLARAKAAIADVGDDGLAPTAHALAARLALMRGAVAQAIEEAEAARRAAGRAGGAVGWVHALTAAAAVAMARGDLGGARRLYAEAETHAAKTVRADLQGELACAHALALYAAGDDAAEAWAARADAFLGPIVRLGGYLAGLHGEVAAETQLRRERVPRAAILHVEAARETYLRFGAEYDVARLHWRQAELHLAQLEAGDGDAAEAVLAQLEDACVIAEDRGLWLPDDARRRALAIIGASVGDEEVAAYCGRVLDRLGVDPDALGDADRALVAPFQASRGVGGAGAYRWVGREGAGGLDQAEYDALVARGEEGLLLALVPEQALWNHGTYVSLSQKRVMMPLLLHFLRSPDEAFTMRELARDVWGAESIDGPVQTKVKVAISRLRGLLGKARSYIVTTRKDEDGANVVAYTLAPDLAFKVVDRSE